MRRNLVGLCAAAAVVALSIPSLAQAEIFTYRFGDTVVLNPDQAAPNVSLEGFFEYNSDNQTLFVQILATGLETDNVHVQHIHGRFDENGNPRDSNNPEPVADDDDNDGFLELVEGLADYGPILLPLQSPAGAGTAGFPDSSSFFFEATYDLSGNNDDVLADGFTVDDLAPKNLQLREYVVHGAIIDPDNIEGNPDRGPGNDDPEYLATLPIISAEIVADPNANAIPLPSSAAMGLVLLGGLGAYGRRRRKA